MKKTLKLPLTCIFLGLILSGCTDSEIKTVKATVYPLDNTLTYEAALSDRKACSDTKWSVLKDDANRTIVQYRCELGNTKSTLQEARDLKLNELNEMMASGIENLRMSIEYSKNRLKSLNGDLQALQVKQAAAQSEIDQFRSTLSPEEQGILDKSIRSIQELNLEYEGGKARQIAMTGPQMFYACMTGDPNFTCPPENEKRAAKMTGILSNAFALAYETQKIQSGNEIQNSENEIQRAEQEIEVMNSDTSEKIEKLKEKFDSIKSITEVHEWAVRENEVVPTYFGFEIEGKSETRKLNQSRNPIQYALWLNRIIRVRGNDYIKPIADQL